MGVCSLRPSPEDELELELDELDDGPEDDELDEGPDEELEDEGVGGELDDDVVGGALELDSDGRSELEEEEDITQLDEVIG